MNVRLCRLGPGGGGGGGAGGGLGLVDGERPSWRSVRGKGEATPSPLSPPAPWSSVSLVPWSLQGLGGRVAALLL